MDRFFALQTLISIVDEGGFAAAAKKLGVSPPVITRTIAALEGTLKTELLRRTTRSVVLTDAGAHYVAHIRGILADLAEADIGIQGKDAAYSGALRIACASLLGEQIVAPALASFAKRHITVTPELALLDRLIHVENEGFDASVSLDAAQDGAGVLASIPVALVASPAYLAAKGRPRSPGDLSLHQGLMFEGDDSWAMRDGAIISPISRGSSNRFEILKGWCVAGLGIAVLPGFLVEQEIGRNDLSVLLDGFEPKPFRLAIDVHPKSWIGQAFRSHLAKHLRQLRL